MGKIGAILGAIHKFTPKGQAIALKTLKENKKLLKNNPLGLTELLESTSRQGQIKLLQKELINPADTVRGVANASLDSYSANLNRTANLESFFDLVIDTGEVVTKNYKKRGIDLLSENFATKKDELINLARKEFLSNKKLIQSLEEAKSPKDLYQCIESLSANIDDYYGTMMEEIIHASPRAEKMALSDFRVMQKSIKTVQKVSDLKFELQKILLKPTEDPNVRKIEDLLKKRYGMHYVHLDNVNDAKNILRTAEIAVRNGVPLPDIIIVTPYLKHSQKGQNTMCKDGLRMVLINSCNDAQCIKNHIASSSADKNLKDMYSCYQQTTSLNIYSTNNPLHLYLHEFVHSEKLLTYTRKKISEKYRDIVEKISDYARLTYNRSNEEVRTELRTKEILEGLNDNESKILSYLS